MRKQMLYRFAVHFGPLSTSRDCEYCWWGGEVGEGHLPLHQDQEEHKKVQIHATKIS